MKSVDILLENSSIGREGTHLFRRVNVLEVTQMKMGFRGAREWRRLS